MHTSQGTSTTATRSLAVSTVSSSPEDRIPWRMRSDLLTAELDLSGTPYFSIKDPVTLRFFQLRGEEFFLLTALNGQATTASLQQAFEQSFAPLRLGQQQLQGYLMSLERQGLILSSQPGYGERLRLRNLQMTRAAWIQRLSSFLVIRFRGVDPNRFLKWMHGGCHWLFSAPALMTAFLTVAGAVLLLLVQWERLVERLPDFGAFFSLQNLLWMVVAVTVIKILHELGHALTCRHFGGECHEMGVIFLIFSPCLYCDVSDAWMMASKWHRIAISAAGILVELFLAAVCTFLWWFTEPGLLNSLLLNMMILCSLNTLLFNGNPLLRFDGYFVMADFIEVPNLQQVSAQLLRNDLSRLCLGTQLFPVRSLPERKHALLVTYALAAAVYRILILFGIVWMLHSVLGRMGMLPVANVLSLSMLLMMILSWGRTFGGTINMIRTNPRVRKNRLNLVVCAFGLLLLTGFLVPLPHRTLTPGVADLRDQQTVFVSVSGQLPLSGSIVRAGDQVQAGDILAELRNAALHRQMIEMQGRINVLESRIDSLQIRRVSDPGAAAGLPSTEQMLSDVQQQYRELLEQNQKLILVAPVSGTVLPVSRQEATEEPSGDLNVRHVDALDPRRGGDTLPGGMLFCRIADPVQVSALLFVDQADVDLIQVGQHVSMAFDGLPDEWVSGLVTQISTAPVERVPPQLAAAGNIPVNNSNSDQPLRPAGVVYQVRTSVLLTDQIIPAGSPGVASIRTSPQTIARRLRRFFAGTLRFTTDFQPQ